MRFAQDNHMIDALASDRSDQPFGEAILPRRAWGDGLVTDAHGAQSACDGSAVDSIPIRDQVARSLIPRRHVFYVGGGVRCLHRVSEQSPPSRELFARSACNIRFVNSTKALQSATAKPCFSVQLKAQRHRASMT